MALALICRPGLTSHHPWECWILLLSCSLAAGLTGHLPRVLTSPITFVPWTRIWIPDWLSEELGKALWKSRAVKSLWMNFDNGKQESGGSKVVPFFSRPWNTPSHGLFLQSIWWILDCQMKHLSSQLLFVFEILCEIAMYIYIVSHPHLPPFLTHAALQSSFQKNAPTSSSLLSLFTWKTTLTQCTPKDT